MSVLADPVVDALLLEFNELVAKIESTGIEVFQRDEPTNFKQIKQLCELSRDARLQLGPPEFADHEQLVTVASCFNSGVGQIRGMWSKGDIPPSVEILCKNITDRAERLLRQGSHRDL